MKQFNLTLICFLLVAFLGVSMTSALSVTNVNSPILTPGQEGVLRITVENTLDDDVEDVSLNLNVQGLPISIVGSSESTEEEIQEGDEEDFSFTLRASSTADPGDYQIPFSLVYENNSKPKTGFVGVRINGTVEIDVLVSTKTPVLNREDQLTVKVINKGFADARYVSVTLFQQGLTILSEKSVYIGDINANDFETATFNVLYTRQNPTISAVIEYRDFENNLIVKNVNEQVKIYGEKEALEKGIIERNNTFVYIIILVILIIIWLAWRAIRKRRRLKSRIVENGAK